ncbi:hypothetical protein Lal_00011688 [Lupinus albus]|nr:hypothetical protein Lal_00011688 [Lupinus albus]
MRKSATWGPTKEIGKTASRKTWGPGLENIRRRSSWRAFPVGSMVARTIMTSAGDDEEESGGIIDKDLLREKIEEFVVVKETATDMVCIRVKLHHGIYNRGATLYSSNESM